MELTQDGGIKKRVLREGKGEATPTPGSTVQVHYVGKLLDGTKFDSSRDRGDKFEFKIGQGQVIKGWDVGVASMKKGELAVLTCTAEYAYGASGSPPKIPPNATLEFEVELFDWDEYTEVSEGIKKKIIKSANGYDKANDRSKVTINYALRLDDGSILETGSKKTIDLLADENLTQGMEEAILSLVKGEKAAFKVESSKAYGSEGDKALRVPPNATVLYDIELLSIDKPKEKWDMNDQEKLEQATLMKTAGNALFKKGKWTKAMSKYSKALSFVEHERPTEDDAKAALQDLKLALHNNSAVCQFQLKQLIAALESSNKALELQPSNIKALTRRATVHLSLGNAEDAQTDVKRALEIGGENKSVLALKKKVKAAMKKDAERERQAFGGLFSR